jgi:hypothetical protein
MQAPIPDASLFGPVFERPIDFIWPWQDPKRARIRTFCQDCSYRDEYALLPREQRTVLGRHEFQRYASRRLLSHVLERERAKAAGLADARGLA